MKTTCSALTICMALVLCAPSVRYVNLPGYAFKTNAKCERAKPKNKFDVKCDYPRLGFPGFSPPRLIIGI